MRLYRQKYCDKDGKEKRSRKWRVRFSIAGFPWLRALGQVYLGPLCEPPVL